MNNVNQNRETIDIIKRCIGDEKFIKDIMEVITVEEIQHIAESRGLSFSKKDCGLLLVLKETSFIKELSAMEKSEEVQAALEKKGISLSLEECAFLRLAANKSIVESLEKTESAEEVRNILEENGITLSPDEDSQLEAESDQDMELSEDELSSVVGGGSWPWYSWVGIVAAGILSGPVGAGVGILIAACTED